MDSEYGKGSHFSFSARTRRGSGTQGAAHSELHVTDPSKIFDGKRILVVEDVEINREILMASLEDTGIIFECAENGVEALGMLAENPERFDLILMDVQMPEMDGYEATRQIRAMDVDWAQVVPILAMTANVNREDIDMSFVCGMNDHIGKPIDVDIIIDKLVQFLV